MVGSFFREVTGLLSKWTESNEQDGESSSAPCQLPLRTHPPWWLSGRCRVVFLGNWEVITIRLFSQLLYYMRVLKSSKLVKNAGWLVWLGLLMVVGFLGAVSPLRRLLSRRTSCHLLPVATTKAATPRRQYLHARDAGCCCLLWM